MQAAVVNVRGQAPKYQSFADPEPQEGEALVSVRAAGLHPLVKGLASGAHYASGGEGPAIPGVDVCAGESPHIAACCNHALCSEMARRLDGELAGNACCAHDQDGFTSG